MVDVEVVKSIVNEKIWVYDLKMKLVWVEYIFDCSKMIFYFMVDGWIDFCELVKDLVVIFWMWIELC